MELQVEAVHQPQGPELFLAQLARQAALDLPAELLHALLHESQVKFVVAVHNYRSFQAALLFGDAR
jgi:hypothetical protein